MELLPELSEELAGFSEQASHLGAPLERRSRVRALLQRIGVTARRAQSLGSAMHTTAFLAGDSPRAARRT